MRERRGERIREDRTKTVKRNQRVIGVERREGVIADGTGRKLGGRGEDKESVCLYICFSGCSSFLHPLCFLSTKGTPKVILFII